MRRKFLTLLAVMLTFSLVSADEMRLFWSPVSQATHYRLFYSDEPFLAVPPDMNAGNETILFVDTADATAEYDLIDLSPNTRYWVCVKAVDASGIDPLYSTDCSNFITGLPNPIIESVTANSIQTPSGRELEVVITGRNFKSDGQQYSTNGTTLELISQTVTPTQITSRFRYTDQTQAGWVNVSVYNDEGSECNFSPNPGPNGEAPYSGCVYDTMEEAFEIVLDVNPSNVENLDHRVE